MSNFEKLSSLKANSVTESSRFNISTRTLNFF